MKSKKLSESILRSIKSKGFKYIDLPPVIEANHIVERSGETFKRFLFSFNDQKGKELCLRPDLTIASCIRYLSRKTTDTEKVYYQGQAFRKTFNKKNSIIRNQIGFEIIGSKNEKKDDQNILETSIKSIKNFGYKTGSLTVGNVEIFKVLLNKLDIPKRWRLRLQRHFWRERYKKMLNENQSKMISGRTVDEILQRFDNKIKDPRRTKKGRNVSKIIKEFLNINCPIDKAAIKLNNFFKKNKINLRVEKNYFPITKNKYQKLNIKFSSSFGRELEYYTGMVFRINIKNRSNNIEINGGRYDNLISDLGAIKKVPAVGAAINLS